MSRGIDWAEATRALLSRWSHLHPDEFSMLCFISQRTLRYNKVTEHMPDRHFKNGICGTDGKFVQAPFYGYCRKKLYSIRKGLEERGLIRQEKVNGYLYITINLRLLLDGEDMEKLTDGSSKSLEDLLGSTNIEHRMGTHVAPLGTTVHIGGVPRYTSNISNRKKKRIIKPDAGASSVPMAQVREVLANSDHLYLKATAKLAAKAYNDFSATNARNLWEQLWRQFYPDLDMQAEPTAADAAMLRRGLSKSDIRPATLLAWVFENWESLTSNQLAWMKDMRVGDAPDFRQISRLTKHFARAYLERDLRVGAARRRVAGDTGTDEVSVLKQELLRTKKALSVEVSRSRKLEFENTRSRVLKPVAKQETKITVTRRRKPAEVDYSSATDDVIEDAELPIWG